MSGAPFFQGTMTRGIPNTLNQSSFKHILAANEFIGGLPVCHHLIFQARKCFAQSEFFGTTSGVSPIFRHTFHGGKLGQVHENQHQVLHLSAVASCFPWHPQMDRENRAASWLSLTAENRLVKILGPKQVSEIFKNHRVFDSLLQEVPRPRSFRELSPHPAPQSAQSAPGFSRSHLMPMRKPHTWRLVFTTPRQLNPLGWYLKTSSTWRILLQFFESKWAAPKNTKYKGPLVWK